MSAQRRAEVIRRITDAFADFKPSVEIPDTVQRVYRNLYTVSVNRSADMNIDYFDWVVDLTLWSATFGLNDPDDKFTWPNPGIFSGAPFSDGYQAYYAEQKRKEAETESSTPQSGEKDVAAPRENPQPEIKAEDMKDQPQQTEKDAEKDSATNKRRRTDTSGVAEHVIKQEAGEETQNGVRVISRTRLDDGSVEIVLRICPEYEHH